MLRLLALDFDGVICDSAPEAFVVAVRTWWELRADGRVPEDGLRAPGGAAPSPDRVGSDPLYPTFLELMPLGNRAEDYAVVLHALESGAEIPDQAAYDAYRDGLDPDWLRLFHRSFYRTRAELSRTDPVGWRRLIGPYPGFLDILRRRAGQLELAIATAKDRASVRSLLRIHGIDDLFGEDVVLDKESGVSKRSHLGLLRDRFDLEFTEMGFLDDKVNHLDSVAPLGVRCGLATWGYNGEREIRLARARGHRVCALTDVERQMFEQ